MARSLLLVAETNKEVVGYANFYFIRESIEDAQLGAIYILPTEQSIGTGSKLLQAGIDELGGVKRIYVDVEKENLVGQRFYEAKGFVCLKEFTEKLQGHTITLKRMVRQV